MEFESFNSALPRKLRGCTAAHHHCRRGPQSANHRPKSPSIRETPCEQQGFSFFTLPPDWIFLTTQRPQEISGLPLAAGDYLRLCPRQPANGQHLLTELADHLRPAAPRNKTGDLSRASADYGWLGKVSLGICTNRHPLKIADAAPAA